MDLCVSEGCSLNPTAPMRTTAPVEVIEGTSDCFFGDGGCLKNELEVPLALSSEGKFRLKTLAVCRLGGTGGFAEPRHPVCVDEYKEFVSAEKMHGVVSA